MASKKEILNKIKILITQKFDNPEDAFAFFDKKGDGYLEKGELVTLVKEAKVNRFLSGAVASALIKELDNDKDAKLDWQEFRKAAKKLIAEV